MARQAIEPTFDVGDIIQDLAQEFGPPVNQVRLDPHNCYTTSELATMYGKSEDVIRTRLKRLRAEGRLIETVKQIEPLGRPGIFMDVPAYQVRNGGDDD